MERTEKLQVFRTSGENLKERKHSQKMIGKRQFRICH